MTKGLERNPLESKNKADLKCYVGVLEFWCWDQYYVYLTCRDSNISKTHIFSALPFTIELDKQRCVNLDKLQKNVPIRYFWEPFTHNKKVLVEIMVEGKWIPIYARRGWKHERRGR